MKTLAELQAIKNRMKDKVILRDGLEGTRVVVGMATCGIAAGARPVLTTLSDKVQEKGLDKILKKVGEECTEVVIAAKNPDPEEMKYEISDLLYHLMVLMAERGTTWEDITKELAERR